MFRYRRAKQCKACVVNHTNSCATNITIAQPRNAPPKPNRQKAIKTVENGEEVATFVPNQNTVQDSYFFSGGFGNPNGSNRKLMTLSRPVKSRLSAINGSFRQGSSWANGYMTQTQSNLESNLGSMGRLDRLKAKAIAGDRNKCFPIKLGQQFYIRLDIDNTTAGYVEGSICSQVGACGKSIFGDVNGCFKNVNLLNFNLAALESSNFPGNYDINSNVFYIYWRQKSGILSSTRPAFNSITISGRKSSDGQQVSVTLLFSESSGYSVNPGAFSGVAGNMIEVSWTPGAALGNRVQDINDIFNGPSGKRVDVIFN